jgi:hypothetical protein
MFLLWDDLLLTAFSALSEEKCEYHYVAIGNKTNYFEKRLLLHVSGMRYKIVSWETPPGAPSTTANENRMISHKARRHDASSKPEVPVCPETLNCPNRRLFRVNADQRQRNFTDEYQNK